MNTETGKRGDREGSYFKANRENPWTEKDELTSVPEEENFTNGTGKINSS